MKYYSEWKDQPLNPNKMKRNIKGFRLNKTGKPILKENADISLDNYNGVTYKHNGEYFYYSGMYQGKYIYKT